MGEQIKRGLVIGDFFPSAATSILYLLLAFSLASCHMPSSVSTSSLQETEGFLRKIAVLPFQSTSPEGFARISEVGTKPASIIKSYSDAPSAAIVEELFWEQLSTSLKIPLVSPSKSASAYAEITSSSFKITFPEALRRLGEKLEVDAVIVGFVYRYRERIGYSYGVDKPASVFFEIQLYRCRDGTLIWRAVFDKTQKSLMEDMLDIKSFVKEKGKWVTAKDLTKEGIREIVMRMQGELKGLLRED
ncbi:MAG: hypothetical protein N2572_02925 [Syntrophales bacterium]|nr:hypothetical protein [Syntrophales bacterium]